MQNTVFCFILLAFEILRFNVITDPNPSSQSPPSTAVVIREKSSQNYLFAKFNKTIPLTHGCYQTSAGVNVYSSVAFGVSILQYYNLHTNVRDETLGIFCSIRLFALDIDRFDYLIRYNL